MTAAEAAAAAVAETPLYMDEKMKIEQNQVFFELSRPVDPNDFDVLEMFLESRRQSGGGELLNVKYLSGKGAAAAKQEPDADQAAAASMTEELQLYRNFSTVSESSDCRFDRARPAWALVAIYEEREVKERVLARRFLKFKDYFMRASPERGGYQASDAYERQAKMVIVENVDPDEDRNVVELYAEHLQPDNELAEIVRSEVFERTCLLIYKTDCDWSKLQARYEKKSQLRNRQLALSQCYLTSCLLLRAPKPLGSSDRLILDACAALNRTVESSRQEATVSGFSVVFVDQIGDCVLLQFENDSYMNHFLQENQDELKKRDIRTEYVYNFGLLKAFQKDAEAAGSTKRSTTAPPAQRQQANKSVQTDLTMKLMNNLLAKSEAGGGAKLVKPTAPATSVPKQSPAPAARQLSDPAVAASKVYPKAKSPTLPADFKLVFPDPADPHKIYVNPEEPLSVGLLNSRQLFSDLELFLKKTSSAPKIETRKDAAAITTATAESSRIVAIHFVHKNFRDKLTLLLQQFNLDHFKHETVPLEQCGGGLSLDAKSVGQLQTHLDKVNVRFPAVFLAYDEKAGTVQVYGASKPIGKTVEALRKYLSQEFCRMVKLNRSQSAAALDDPLVESKPVEVKKGQETTPKVVAANAVGPIGPVVVFINSYEADVNKFKLFERGGTNDSGLRRLVHKITPREHPVLMQCLFYCSKVLQDFLADLCLFELNLDLFVDLEPASAETAATAGAESSRLGQSLCVVMTHGPVLSEQEERLVRLKVLALLDQYEKTRLRHMTVRLAENLNQPAFMADLVAKFTAKSDLAKLLKLLDAQYDSTKVVHLELSSVAALAGGDSKPPRQFEIYGYQTAVQQTSEYVQSSLGKLHALLGAKMHGKLEFKLTLKKNSNVIVFFKFDEIFYKDFQTKLAELDAFAVKLSEQPAMDAKKSGTAELALQFGCTSAKLRTKKLENWDEISQWRQRVDAFVEKYLSYFSSELIDMPFRREDPKAGSLLYDRNMIDVVWATSQKLQVVGVREEIQRLRQRIVQISYGI